MFKLFQPFNRCAPFIPLGAPRIMEALRTSIFDSVFVCHPERKARDLVFQSALEEEIPRLGLGITTAINNLRFSLRQLEPLKRSAALERFERLLAFM